MGGTGFLKMQSLWCQLLQVSQLTDEVESNWPDSQLAHVELWGGPGLVWTSPAIISKMVNIEDFVIFGMLLENFLVPSLLKFAMAFNPAVKRFISCT